MNLSSQAKSGEVRSLVRGLNLLVQINKLAPAGVSDLVRASGLPKATTIRLLSTLREAGYVRQDPATSLYEPLPTVLKLAAALKAEDGFVDIARRQLNEFGQQVNWPSELMMAESDAMVILASNRETSPIQLRLFEQRRFPVLRSAGGLAWLSALPDHERDAATERLCALDTTPSSGAGSTQAQVAQTREQILITRRNGYSKQLYKTPVAGMQAIGVAVIAAHKSVGALVLITLESVVPIKQIEHQLIPRLQETARALGRDYELRTR